MKKYLVLAVLMLAGAIPAKATWAEVQHVNKSTCVSSQSFCTITVSATGAGNVGVLVGMMKQVGSAFNYPTSATGAGTWVLPTINNPTGGCTSGGGGTNPNIGCAYNLNLTAGVTSFTLQFRSDPNVTWRIDFLEFSSGNPKLFDVANWGLSNSASPGLGVPLAISGTSDVIVQAMVEATGTPSACSSPFNTNGIFDSLGAVCYAINSTQMTPPTYTGGSGQAASCGIAISEVVTQKGIPIGPY